MAFLLPPSAEAGVRCSPQLSKNMQNKKKKKKKETVPGQMLGCQWLTGSYLSFNLSLLLSLSLVPVFTLFFSKPSLPNYLSGFWFGTEEADGNCSRAWPTTSHYSPHKGLQGTAF